MKLTKRTSHENFCGTRWFNKTTDVVHLVAFDGTGSMYMIIDLEDGEVSFSSDDIREVIEEVKKNYYE